MNETVSLIEQALIKWLVSLAMARLVVAFPVLAGWLSGPVGWLLSLAAGVFIKYGDLATYVLIDGWQTSQEAGNYENATNAVATAKDKAQALLDQENAFKNLFG